GREPGDTLLRNTEVAFKYRMSAVQAALGLAQLERVEELVSKKRRIFEWYRDGLDGLDGVALNAEPPGVVNAYWMVTAITDDSYGLTKEDIIRALSAHGMDSRPFFNPLSSLPAYRHLPAARSGPHRNPVSYRLGATGVNLPSALSLGEEQVQAVCSAFRDTLAAARKGA